MAVCEIKIKTDITNRYLKKLGDYAVLLSSLFALKTTLDYVLRAHPVSKTQGVLYFEILKIKELVDKEIERLKRELNTDEQESKCVPTAEPVQEQDVKEPGAFPINAADVDGYF